ncbi:MAG: PIN domain-containing protein [Flavobacteriales bacterium]|nr:PIN domain-containing protein [Flavobacteriales bacterium]MBP9080206.1 PIN domain-containing protein [Flavobacteriales bacterium]
MQRIFLDANILVSVLCNEYPRFSWCARVLSLCDDKHFEVYTSPLCLAISAHFSKKKNGLRPCLHKMALLASKLKMTTLDQDVVLQTVANKKVGDFEDGLEYYSAKTAGCTCIVTYDRNDFHFGDMEVLDAEDFLVKYALPLHRKARK